MLNKPHISIWVLQTGWIYSMRVSSRYSNWYWHSNLAYSIPFCHRYEEDVELFLKRHPELRNAVYTAINNKERCYENSYGLVNFYPESYKYDITRTISRNN